MTLEFCLLCSCHGKHLFEILLMMFCEKLVYSLEKENNIRNDAITVFYWFLTLDQGPLMIIYEVNSH